LGPVVEEENGGGLERKYAAGQPTLVFTQLAWDRAVVILAGGWQYGTDRVVENDGAATRDTPLDCFNRTKAEVAFDVSLNSVGFSITGLDLRCAKLRPGWWPWSFPSNITGTSNDSGSRWPLSLLPLEWRPFSCQYCSMSELRWRLDRVSARACCALWHTGMEAVWTALLTPRLSPVEPVGFYLHAEREQDAPLCNRVSMNALGKSTRIGVTNRRREIQETVSDVDPCAKGF